TEAHLDHLALAGRQRPQHFLDPLPQQVLIDRLAGVYRARIVQEVTEGAFALAAEWLVNAYRVPRHHAQRPRLFGRNAQARRDLLDGRLAAGAGRQLAADALHRREGADLV